MPKPIDQAVPDRHQIGSSPAVKENRCSPLGIVKDFTHSARAKATEVMRDVALSIARKIDGIWDRISPRHEGSALMGINSIFKDPTISIPQLNERMAPPVPTHKEVKALFDLRSEIFQLSKVKSKEAEIKIDSKIEEYEDLLAKAGGREGDFFKQVDDLGFQARERARAEHLQKEAEEAAPAEESRKVGYASGNSMDFELEGLKAVLEGAYADVRGVRVESDKPYSADHFEIDVDHWNWTKPSQSIDRASSAKELEAPVDEQIVVWKKASANLPLVQESRDALFSRLPTGTIKEKTLVAGLKYLRANKEAIEGPWRIGGNHAEKKEKLSEMNRKESPKVPEFNSVPAATDVLKVLIGAVDDRTITPYLDHQLSFEQFNGLTDLVNLSEEECTLEKKIEGANYVLKEAFNGDTDKLAMFKALLVLLKETSEHSVQNSMSVENLAVTPLNQLLQRNIAPVLAQGIAKDDRLGVFLFNNADAILADI